MKRFPRKGDGNDPIVPNNPDDGSDPNRIPPPPPPPPK